MSCSEPVKYVINAAEQSHFDMPRVLMTDNYSRESTMFVIPERTRGVSIMGTFDEIAEFAASLIGSLYSWPIVHDRDDFLGEPVQPDTEGNNIYVIYRHGQQGGAQDGGDSDESSGTDGDAA